MLENFLFIVMLILQAALFGLILSNDGGVVDLSIFASVTQSLILIIGLFVGYFLLKEEIKFKKRLEVHDRVTDILINKLYRSFNVISNITDNSYYIKKSDPRKLDDYPTTYLKKRVGESGLIKEISDFQSSFLMFYEFFEFWKALFSKEIDREMKFLFDLEIILNDDLWSYQRKLSDYSLLSLTKEPKEIEKERKNLLLLGEDINRKVEVLSNGLTKFVLDISKEIFKGLFRSKKDEENRLFKLELENANNKDPLVVLTEKGFKTLPYKKTVFQEEFGESRERRKSLRIFLDKDKQISE
jgi:hypothetical protein